MTHITAVELENFQSIEGRTRIEFRPITLLYGPNSAGKSAVFDALELLRVLLDPLAADEEKAADMLTRWARNGEGAWRSLFVAVEFPFSGMSSLDVWRDDHNFQAGNRRSKDPAFFIDPNDIEDQFHNDAPVRIKGAPVRVEMRFKLREIKNQRKAWLCLDELACSIGGLPVMRVGKASPEVSSDGTSINYSLLSEEHVARDEKRVEKNESATRWLEIFEVGELGFLNWDLLQKIKKAEQRDKIRYHSTVQSYNRIYYLIESDLFGRNFIGSRDVFDTGNLLTDTLPDFCRNAHDIMFYFGTMLWKPLRNSTLMVHADRRSPSPEEALTVIDPGLEGWWPTNAMAPSSPAWLLKSLPQGIDEHFKGLAHAAHAALLLRSAASDFWGDSHALKELEPLRPRAAILDRVNHHLEERLFTEKLYKVECASTLMVPIDLKEDDPWGYYAFAQPAAVRLFLREPSGARVELQDVGSGVSYVLPVLYALSSQGFVQVQQPELHLHPALQAAMADVFVEELHRAGRGQFLIETHSENLLLRFLRRIRDTEKGRALSDDVKLTNNDIAVYYFDPAPGGGTFVSRQLVTPLGDFYNDWPRGFFTERRKDLFDEE